MEAEIQDEIKRWRSVCRKLQADGHKLATGVSSQHGFYIIAYVDPNNDELPSEIDGIRIHKRDIEEED